MLHDGGEGGRGGWCCSTLLRLLLVCNFFFFCSKQGVLHCIHTSAESGPGLVQRCLLTHAAHSGRHAYARHTVNRGNAPAAVGEGRNNLLYG